VKKVGFDMDGVIADWVKSYTMFNAERIGTPVFSTEEYPQPFELTAFYQSPRSFDNMYNLWLTSSQNPFVRVPDIDKHQTAYIAANQHKFDIYFLTSRDESSGASIEEQTTAWLERRGITSPQVFHTSHPQRPTSKPSKGQVSAALGLDYFIDDRTVELESIIKHSPHTTPILMNRPYNQIETGIQRVNNIYQYLERVDNE
jgi:hypothetical protein